jgi:hypothetical protein
VVVDDPQVSRAHLELRFVDGGWEAVDLGSSLGTVCNGERITRRRLQSGDQLAIGGIGLLAVDLEPPAAAAPAVAAPVVAAPAPPRPVPARAVRGRRRETLQRVAWGAVALVAAATLGLGGWLLVERVRRTSGGVATSVSPGAAFSDAAARALLDPSTDGVARTTLLGAFRATSDGDSAGRFEHDEMTLELPVGALPLGTAVRVSRVEAAPAAMRNSFPRERWGQLAPLTPFYDVDTGRQSLGHPAVVSFPLPRGAEVRSLTALSFDPKTGAWDSAPARLDPTSGRVVAEVPHFSIVHIAGVVVFTGVAIYEGALLNWDWLSSGTCLETAPKHFQICWSGDPSGAYRPIPIPDPGDGGPAVAAVPELVASLATGLERAYAAFAAANFQVPAYKTWVYLVPASQDGKLTPSQDALFQAPPFVGKPFLYVNQAANPALAEASAAHELFHCVQLNTVGSAISLWWMEASAVGVETAVYPRSIEWIKSYYTGPRTGTAELDSSLPAAELLPEDQRRDYGYRVSLFPVFLTRTRGGLDLQARILGWHKSQPIMQALGSALEGPTGLERTWLAFGRSLVGPDWGQYLSADERRLLTRRLIDKRLQIEPTLGWAQHVRPSTPLSALLYDVRINRSLMPAGRQRGGPLLVGMTCSGNRELHLMVPSLGPQSANRAEELSTLPVVESLHCQSPARSVRRLDAQRATRNDIDALAWLVDGETLSPSEVDVRATWLLPPENARLDPQTDELRWDAHPLADRAAKPAAPWDTYVVYRRQSPNAEPEIAGGTQVTSFEIPAAEDHCAEYAVTARLRPAAVYGKAESDPSDWIPVGLPTPKGFTLEGRLVEKGDRDPRTEVEVEASEETLGIRGLEIERTVAGQTAVLYSHERRADRQQPGTYRPGEPVVFGRPPAGTAFRVVARAWLLPRDHRCFDPAVHLLEKVIAEEPGDGSDAPVAGREVCQLVERKEARWEEMESGTWQVTSKPASVELLNVESGRTMVVAFTEPPAKLRMQQEVPVELTCTAPPGYSEQGAIGTHWQTTHASGEMDFDGTLISCGASNEHTSGQEREVVRFGSGEPPGRRELVKLKIKAVAGSNYYYLFLGWWYDCR